MEIKKNTKEALETKIRGMNTTLNKIAYLESAIKQHSTFEIKRYIWSILAELYEERKMYEKAAKSMANKAGVEVTFREKIDSYIKSAELYSNAGKPDDAEEMFTRASRNSNQEQKNKIKLAMKNIFLITAQDLEKKGKKASALKFYEKLIKMSLDDLEKKQIKEKLLQTYKALGKFREAKLIEGL